MNIGTTQIVEGDVDMPSTGSVPSKAHPEGHFHALGKNVLLKYTSEISRLFQLAFFVVVARRFGAGELGRLTVLLMIGSTVMLLVGDLGINTTTIARMSGHDPQEQAKVASDALFWKNVLTMLTLVLICALMFLMRGTEKWIVILAVAAISLGSLWLEFLCALTNGVNRLDSEVWLRIAYRGVIYGGGTLVAFLASLNDDLVYMAAATVAVLVGATMLLNARLLPLKVLACPEAGTRLVRQALPVWITQLAQLSYLRFDMIILGFLNVAALQLGWYAAAWKIADVLTAIPALLSGAALPLISGKFSEMNLRLIAPRYLRLMYVLPFLFALPLALGANWITRLLYGDGFLGTPHVLRILIWALVPVFVHTFLAIVAVATSRQAEAAKFAMSASLLTVVSALIFVPKFGFEAMAVVSLVANLLFACAMVYKFRDVTGSTQFGIALRSVASAMGIYWICLHFQLGSHPAVLMAGGTSAYCLMLVLSRVITVRHMGHAWRFLAGLTWGREAGGISPA